MPASKEFGSDFHLITLPQGKGLRFASTANYYVSGRQPLEHVIASGGYRRVWIPSYYCGESIRRLPALGVELRRYPCLPTDDAVRALENLPLEECDLLMRVNFFGLHGWCDNSAVPCDVIEDHTHDLTGRWAAESNADWCFASLRKTLPVADGGVLWSGAGARHRDLPPQPQLTPEAERAMELRYEAMRLKSEYLAGADVDKDEFLKKFAATEDIIGELALSDHSPLTRRILESCDVDEWYAMKRRNHARLLSALDFHEASLLGEGADEAGTVFSLLLLYDSKERRDEVRRLLISRGVYAAILWPDPYSGHEEARSLSERILSVHCDGRYSLSDMDVLAERLRDVI